MLFVGAAAVAVTPGTVLVLVARRRRVRLQAWSAEIAPGAEHPQAVASPQVWSGAFLGEPAVRRNRGSLMSSAAPANARIRRGHTRAGSALPGVGGAGPGGEAPPGTLIA